MRIGIDLGGTKIEIAALDDAGVEAIRRRVATPAGDYGATLAALAALTREVEGEVGTCSIGIGAPGAASRRTGLVKNANSTVLIGKPLHADLERVLQRPVRIANDANCFTLSEATDGAAAGEPLVFGVILGTGVGGGLAFRRCVIEGRNAIAGEWGHNPLPWARDEERPGPPCYCGKRGCLETFLSGPALAREYALRTGREHTAQWICAAAPAGDGDAAAVVNAYADRLARGLAHVVNILDPDAIVLGGGLSNVAALYERVPDLMRRYVFSDDVATPVVRARHGDSSGVRGAAWLW
jgi:fructokinase